MKQNFIDISEFTNKPTIESTRDTIVKNVIARRKELKLSQEQLANKSCVSYGSIKRFETTGEISLTSLIKIANVLNLLQDLNNIFANSIITDLSKDWK